jgi:hypothetical protein
MKRPSRSSNDVRQIQLAAARNALPKAITRPASKGGPDLGNKQHYQAFMFTPSRV